MTEVSLRRPAQPEASGRNRIELRPSHLTTPVAMIGGVAVVIGALFAIVLSLVVLAYALS